MKVDGLKITGLTTHQQHDGELVMVTAEAGGVVAQLQTKDPGVGAAWKKEHEETKAEASE